MAGSLCFVMALSCVLRLVSIVFDFVDHPPRTTTSLNLRGVLLLLVASAETSSTSQQSLSLLSCATILTQGHEIRNRRLWLCGCPDHHIQLCERIHVVIATPKMDRSTSLIPSSSAWLTLRREE